MKNSLKLLGALALANSLYVVSAPADIVTDGTQYSFNVDMGGNRYFCLANIGSRYMSVKAFNQSDNGEKVSIIVVDVNRVVDSENPKKAAEALVKVLERKITVDSGIKIRKFFGNATDSMAKTLRKQYGIK